MQFGQLALKRCRYGWMLFTGPYIGKCFELYGEYSESEVSLMRQFVRPGATVIEVGANIGSLTIPLALMAGESGRVFAYESHPDVYNVLCANLALNGIRNTLPTNAFVSPSADVDTASPAWGKFAYVSERWPTRFAALDSLNLERCDFMKIDVDGKELEVLQSGRQTIERCRPVLYFENDVKEASARLLDFAMNTLQYDLYLHPAPIWQPDNFFGNPHNHWGSPGILSLMVLGVPRERDVTVDGMRMVLSPDEWWDFE